MKFSLFAGAVASLVAFVSAQTSLAPKGELLVGQNAVLSPNTQQPVTAGQPFTVTWEPGTVAGTISLVLLKGPAVNIIPQFYIAQGIPNTGSFTWNVPADLEATETEAAGYGIRLDIDATGNYQYSTQFGVKGGVKASPSVAPSAAPSVAPSAAPSVAPSSAPVVPGPAGASKSQKVIYSTETITATSCACTKGENNKPEPTGETKPNPSGVAKPSGTGAVSPPKNGTSTHVPTYVKPTAVPSKPAVYEGAAGKIQVGGAALVVMFASMVALF